MRPRKNTNGKCGGCKGSGMRTFRVMRKRRRPEDIVLKSTQSKEESVCDLCGGSGRTYWAEERQGLSLRDLEMGSALWELDEQDSRPRS